jgi:hypothetical protein
MYVIAPKFDEPQKGCGCDSFWRAFVAGLLAAIAVRLVWNVAVPILKK